MQTQLIKKLSTLFLITAFATTNAVAQDFFEKAIKAHQEGEYITAIQNLNSDLRLNPKHSDGYLLRASSKYYLEDYNEALSDVQQAIKFFDKKTSIYKEAQLYSERGDIYRAIEEYEDAIKSYSEAIKKEPKEVDFLLRRAVCYSALTDYVKSDADYKKALELDNSYMAANLGLVDNMISREEYDDALTYLNRLEKIDPRNYRIFYKRAIVYAEKEDFKKAIDDMIQSMYYSEIDRYSTFWIQMWSLKNLDYVCAKIKSKILTDTDNKYNWRDLLASVYDLHKKYLDAISVYNEQERDFGSGLRILYYRGKIYDKIGAYNQAIADFDAGIKQDPDEAEFYVLRAEAYNAQGKFNDAISDFNRAINLNPMNEMAYYKRSWAKWMYKKDYQSAIEDISMAITIDDEYAYYYLVRARLYQEIKKTNLAEEDFNKVIELDSAENKLYALILQGKPREAYDLIDTIISKDSTDYYNYACIYSLLNNQQKALDYLDKALNDGWRDFVHIEYDPDMDNIRNSDAFKTLISKYKQIYKEEMSSFDSRATEVESSRNKEVYVVPIKKLKSNLYEVICSINGVPMKFLFDTGASGVLLSRTEADFLLKNDYLKSYDIGEKRKSKIANGSIVESTGVKLRKFKIGDLELENIDASIMDSPDVDLLLGQSVLQKFGKVEIDNERSVMIITIAK
jgi:clan AA aspartic protease (TIGR02281 family)